VQATVQGPDRVSGDLADRGPSGDKVAVSSLGLTDVADGQDLLALRQQRLLGFLVRLELCMLHLGRD